MLRWGAARSALLARRSVRALSTRQAAQMETQVLEKLRGVSDGLGLGDIVSLGRVKVAIDTLWNDTICITPTNALLSLSLSLSCSLYISTGSACDARGWKSFMQDRDAVAGADGAGAAGSLAEALSTSR